MDHEEKPRYKYKGVLLSPELSARIAAIQKELNDARILAIRQEYAKQRAHKHGVESHEEPKEAMMFSPNARWARIIYAIAVCLPALYIVTRVGWMTNEHFTAAVIVLVSLGMIALARRG